MKAPGRSTQLVCKEAAGRGAATPSGHLLPGLYGEAVGWKDSALQTEACWLSLGHFWVTCHLWGPRFLVCTGGRMCGHPKYGRAGQGSAQSWAGGICARFQVSSGGLEL